MEEAVAVGHRAFSVVLVAEARCALLEDLAAGVARDLVRRWVEVEEEAR